MVHKYESSEMNGAEMIPLSPIVFKFSIDSAISLGDGSSLYWHQRGGNKQFTLRLHSLNLWSLQFLASFLNMAIELTKRLAVEDYLKNMPTALNVLKVETPKVS